MLTAYDVWLAYLREFEGMERRWRESSTGKAVLRAADPWSTYYQDMHTWLGNTAGGKVVGEMVRATGSTIQKIPGLTLRTSAIRAICCTDLLAERARKEPDSPLRWMQLAEAYDLEVRILRMSRLLRGLTHPRSLATSLLIREVAALGKPRLQSNPRAQRCMQKADNLLGSKVKGRVALGFDDLIAASRLYLMSEKYGLAAAYARRAVEFVRQERQNYKPDEPLVWGVSTSTEPTGRPWVDASNRFFAKVDSFMEGLVGFVNEAFEVLDAMAAVEGYFRAWKDGEIYGVPAEERFNLAEGIAWTAVAWAYLGAGKHDLARQAANKAKALDVSLWREIHAALPVEGNWFGERIENRIVLLDMVYVTHRRVWRGAGRGSFRIMAATGVDQWQKVTELAD